MELGPDLPLGKYRLERRLGKGGMGEVWAAHDPDLDRRVALKVLHAHVAHAGDARARFQREGRAMARLRHPNVIAVHDATFSSGRGVIAMEIVDGENLAMWAVRPRGADDIVRVALAAGRGLVAAHDAGMIHRDFKPHNVLIDRVGRVVVTDFGLARGLDDEPRDSAPVPRISVGALDATATPVSGDEATVTPTVVSRAPGGSGELSSQLTETGTLLGTPAYMAPEQLAGGAVDQRADQFAFCVSMWELFAGERPFRGATLDELADAVERGDVTPSAKVPRRLRGILVRGLAADPARRWPSMAALLRAIDRAWRRPRRLAMAGVVMVLLAGVATAFALTRPEPVAEAPLCGDADAELASAWSPQIRGDLVTSLVDKPYQGRIVRLFDRWASSWKSIHAANCAKPADPDFVPRKMCLEATRDEIGSMMQRRSTLPAEMWGAPDMARLIVMPDACMTNPRNLMPAPPPAATRDEVTSIRVELATARVPLITRSIAALAIDLTDQVARARKTGYAPVIVEARLLDAIFKRLHADRTELGPICATFAEVVALADRVGYERMLVEALVLHYNCADMQGAPEAESLLERLRTITQRTRNPVQLAEVELLLATRARLAGMVDEALEHVTNVRAAIAGLEMDEFASEAVVEEARIRFARHRDGDLARAAALMRAERSHPELAREIDWHLGKAIAPPPNQAAGEVSIEVRVVDANGPVAGARVAAAPRLYADATREAMAEKVAAVTGVTGADGSVKLSVPAHSVVLVRAGGQVGAALATGMTTVQLVPAAVIAGSASAPSGADPKSRDDLAGMAAHRWPAVIYVADDALPIVWAAPVVAGLWRIAVPPGRYHALVQADNGLVNEARQAAIEVRAGDNAAPALALVERPGVLEVIARPGTPGTALALHATAVPATWNELRAAIAATDYLAADSLAPWTAPGAHFGDMVARVATAGDTVVCIIEPSVHPEFALSVWDVPRDAKPPICKRASPSERLIIAR